MSWDIVLLNSTQKITLVEDVDEALLEPTDFCTVLEKHFRDISRDDIHCEIKGRDFAIAYIIDDEKVSNKILTLYEENALYERVILARK